MTAPTETLDQLVRSSASVGCAEDRLLLSRRGVLGLTAGLFASASLPTWANASGCSARDPRLLVVVLRGGMDGLSALVPYADRAYVDERGKLALSPDRLFKLTVANHPSGYWGLHPSFKTLNRLYGAGNVSFVHGVAPPERNRSHFDCQENLENGMPEGKIAKEGWLNRFLQGATCPASSSTLAIQIGRAPLILRGKAAVMGWTPSLLPHLNGDTTKLISDLYKARKDTQLLNALAAGLAGQEMAGARDAGPDDELSTDTEDKERQVIVEAFRGAGKLLAAANGPRIASLNVDGWDTHTNEVSLKDLSKIDEYTEFGIGRLFSNLDAGIAAFEAAAKAVWSETVVLVVTEFGRMVSNNGNLGADHGTGSIAMLVGGAVKGGQIAGEWDDLSKLLEGRDLRAPNDLRSVFKTVLSQHFGLAANSDKLNGFVFPNSANARLLTEQLIL